MSHYRYRNPWFTEGKPHYGPEFFTTDAKPIEYRGFQIFQRVKGTWDLVKDGVCLTQRAGRNGPRHCADGLLGGASEDCPFNIERARTIAAAHGISFSQSQAA